ncbi:MAG TPA: acyltransferase family protein [Polyangiaceae bacterium]|nr:acyltransferase family protein [Polyangiaceae bacterium]
MDGTTVPGSDGAAEGERYHAFDAARASMMLLGLVLHSVMSYIVLPVDDWQYKDGATSFAFDVLAFGIHSFRMPVFFVLAGFFSALLLTRRGLASFARNRAQRVLVPFVVGYALLVPLAELTNHYSLAVRAEAHDPLAVALAALARNPHPDLAHLWFLYDLLFFYGASLLVLAWVPARFRSAAARAGERLIAWRWRALLLALPLFALQLGMPRGMLDTSLSLMPDVALLAFYGLFFGFGALLWSARAQLATLERHVKRNFALSLPLAMLNLTCIVLFDEAPSLDPWLLTAASALSGALLSWVLTFAWLGLFLRHCQHPRPWLRYLTDASYWMYLVHLPLTLWLPSFFTQLDLPAFVKASGVFTGTFVLSLASYALLVRSSWLGVLLNGKRQPRLRFELTEAQRQLG